MSKLTYAVEVQLWVAATTSYSTTWTDITQDVIMPGLIYSSGTSRTTIKDRVSDIGQCTFDLNNSEANSAKLAGYYSPGHTNARVGFDMGCPLRVRYTYNGVTWTKWYGRIVDIAPEPGTKLSRRTGVTALDWFHQASKYTLKLPSYETNKRIDEAMLIVVQKVPVQPLSNNFKTGRTTFPVIFDNLDYRTTAFAEFQKLATSEIGNIYLKHNIAQDEILESTGWKNRYHDSTTVNSEYTLPDSASSRLLDEDGSILLDEDGSYLLSDDTAEIAFADGQSELVYSYADFMANHIEVTAYPRSVNNTIGVLFTMTDPVLVKAGETIDWFKVIYKDPSSRAYAVCGKDIVPVVPTTDYLFNTASDGSGTDITSDLAITGIYGVNDTELSFKNNSASDGYITFLQIRGKAINLIDSITRISEDTDLIKQYGLSEFKYEMKYQPPALEALTYWFLVNLNKPHFVSTSYHYANSPNAKSLVFYAGDDEAIAKFLAIDCNSRVIVNETQTAIDGFFYVQGYESEVIGNNADTGLIVQNTLFLSRAEIPDIIIP